MENLREHTSEEGDVLIGVGTGDENRALDDLFAPSGNGH